MLLRALLTSSVALGLLGGCPPGGGGDAGAVGGGAGGGVAEDAGQGGGGQVLLNPSRFNIVLGRPTDTSIAVSVLASAPGDQVFVEYAARLTGDEQGLLDAARSPTARSMSGEPMVVELTGLSPNTRYFDRVVVQPAGQAAQADALHTFHTHRARGAAFHFGVQGDTHPERWNGKMFHGELFTLTMQEVARRQPDFYGTLGDDFSSEKIIQDFKAANFAAGHRFTRAVEGVAPYETYRALTRPFVEAMLVDGERALTGSAAWRELRQRYFGLMTPSTALFLVNGNHEQAHLANLGGLFNNAAVWAADARLKYYPLPAPGGFYSGDEQRLTDLVPRPGGRENNGYRGLAAAGAEAAGRRAEPHLRRRGRRRGHDDVPVAGAHVLQLVPAGGGGGLLRIPGAVVHDRWRRADRHVLRPVRRP